MQERYIHTADELTDLCRDLSASPWLALDTEFIREKSYFPRLCLVQVANESIAAAVDVLALEDWSPFLDLLYRDDIVKVFHAARQDLEILHQLRGGLPTPLFDTQPAAALLGHGEQVGYGELVEKELGVVLEKGHGRTDWATRPLSQNQLRYALDDVIYLGRLFTRVRDGLMELGRVDWLDEEFAALADPATYVVAPMEAWRKVKGRNRLRGAQMAVLQQLAAWREEQARERDRPRKWILKDEVMLDMARRMPEQASGLTAIRGFDAGMLSRHGEALLERIRRGRSLPSEEWPREKQPPPRLSENQQAQADLLAAALRLIGEQRAINGAAIASRKDLERLVGGERDIPLLKGWRKGVAGALLLEVLEGRRDPRIREGVLDLHRVE